MHLKNNVPYLSNEFDQLQSVPEHENTFSILEAEVAIVSKGKSNFMISFSRFQCVRREEPKQQDIAERAKIQNMVHQMMHELDARCMQEMERPTKPMGLVIVSPEGQVFIWAIRRESYFSQQGLSTILVLIQVTATVILLLFRLFQYKVCSIHFPWEQRERKEYAAPEKLARNNSDYVKESMTMA